MPQHFAVSNNFVLPEGKILYKPVFNHLNCDSMSTSIAEKKYLSCKKWNNMPVELVIYHQY